jgi:hypothetical protein
MIWTILSTIISIIIVIWLVATFGMLVVIVPVLLGSSMAYVESGHNWQVFIPAAVIIAVFAWIDSKIS